MDSIFRIVGNRQTGYFVMNTNTGVSYGKKRFNTPYRIYGYARKRMFELTLLYERSNTRDTPVMGQTTSPAIVPKIQVEMIPKASLIPNKLFEWE